MTISKAYKTKKIQPKQQQANKHSKKQKFYYTLVNILTLGRMLVVPIVGVLIYYDTYNGAVWALNITILACITDWLDGILARRFNIRSQLGRFLDPIADKMLVVGVLLFVLIWRDESIWVEVSALCIVAREIIISGLREHMASTKIPVKVIFVAKFKTAVQCVGISMLIGKPIAFNVLWFSEYTLEPYYNLTTLMLVASAILAVVSAYDYFMASFHYLVAFKEDK